MRATCGHAVTSSRMLEAGVEPRQETWHRPGDRIDLTTAFWLATAGGADLLGIDAGLLRPGKVFDAIAIDLSRDPSAIDLPLIDAATPGVDTRRFERIARGQGDITHVWVDGKLRHTNP